MLQETPVLGKKNEDFISCIIQAMNVSCEEAEAMLKDAEERLGISSELYCKYSFFDVPVSMQEAMFEKVKLAEQRQTEKANEQREKKERYEAEIARNTGWDADKVREELQNAEKRLGVTLEEYFENEYYRMTAEEQEECHNRLQEEREEQRKLQQEKKAEARAKAISSIALQTGRSKRDIDRALTEVQTIFDITPEQYRDYRVFDVDQEELQTWVPEVIRLDNQKNARLLRIRKGRIERAAMHLGVSEEEAEAVLSEITKEYKLTFEESVKHRFYSLPEEEKEEAAKEILDTRAETSRGYGRKYLNDLATDLNCSTGKADAIFKEARGRLGVSSYLYTLYRFQDIPLTKQAEWYRKVLVEEEDRKERMNQAVESRIERVAMRAGWSHAEAEQAMADAFERSEISYAEYLQNDFYLLSAEEQDEIHQELEQEREELQAQERKECIDAIVENKGCSAEEAEAMLADAERRLKITPQAYRRYLFFDIPVSAQWERYQEIKGQLSDRTQVQIDDNESYLAKIIDATGWTKEETLKNVRRAKEISGASWKDFYAFKFWDIDEEQQTDYFTTEVSKAVGKKYDELRSRDIFVNKEVFLERFKEYLGRGWLVSNKVTEEEFAEEFKNTKKVLYKPSNNGNSGSGIEVFDLTDGCEEAYNRISTLPRGIVEGYLVQHEEMNRLYPYSVNTIRVASICHDGKVEIPYAILRVGANKSFVDNFTTGGMVADMDLETGKARTDAVDVHGKCFELHPDTQVPIKGFEVPYFKEGLEMVRRAGRDVNGYIGWDVAITEEGPVLIEGNVDPGNRLLQMPHIPEKRGMAHVMRQFL